MPRKYVMKFPHRKLTPEKIRMIRTLLVNGYPVSEVAKSVGVSRQHLHRLINQYGFERGKQ